MNGSSDKQVKVGVGVSTQEFAQARAQIRQLTTELRQLVDAANQLRQGGLGSMGATSGMGVVTTRPGAQQAQGLRPGGGGFGGITGGILADAKAMSQVADAGTKALRSMTQGAKTSISDQIQNIERLKRSVQDLGRAYDQLNARAYLPNGHLSPSAGLGSVAALAGAPGAMAGAQSQLAATNANQLFAQSMGVYNQPVQPTYTQGGITYYGTPPPQVGLAQRAWAFGNRALPGSGLASAAGSWIGQTMRHVAGPVASVVGAYEGLNRAVVGADSARADAILTGGQYQTVNNAAGINQIFGGIGMSARRNVNSAIAAASLTPTDLRAALGPEAFEALVQKARASVGATGGIGQVAGDFKDYMGAGLSREFGSSVGGLDNTVLARQMALEVQNGNIPLAQAQRVQDMYQSRLNMQSVRESTYRSEFVNDRMGRMALMRQSGVRGTVRSPHNGQTYDAIEMLGAGSPYSKEELGGYMGTVRGALGRGVGEVTARGLLSATYGGLGNAADLYGIAAGYGAPGAFMDSVQGGLSFSGARGMVDVGAGAQVGGLYANAMTQGDMFTSGAAGMQGMMAATAGLGGDLRAARAMGAGFQQLGAYSSGSTDRLQQAINVLASVRAAPGQLYTQETLRNMSPAARLDIMRKINSGKMTDANLPYELKVQGVTTAGLKAYGQNRDSLLFSRYVSGQGSADMEAAVAGIRSKGLAGYLHGFEGKNRQQQLTAAAAALSHAGGGTLEQTRAILMQLAAEDPTLVKSLRGGGVRDIAAGSEDALYQADEGLNALDKGKYLASDKFKRDVRSSQTTEAKALADMFEKMGQQFGSSLGKEAQVVARELSGLAEAIHQATVNIRNDAKGSGRSRAAAP